MRELIQKVLNEGDIGFAEKTLSEGYVERNPMPGGTADKAGAIAMFTMMRQQTPDMRIEIEDVVASANKVAVRSTMHGTDTEGFMPVCRRPGSRSRWALWTYSRSMTPA